MCLIFARQKQRPFYEPKGKLLKREGGEIQLEAVEEVVVPVFYQDVGAFVVPNTDNPDLKGLVS